MSFPYGDSTAQRPLSGPIRSDSNPRLHSQNTPYSRPQQGPAGEFGQQRISPNKPIQTTRPALVKSASARTLGGLTRSDSDSSLFSGLKSLVSRPIRWFVTPKKAGREDAEMDAGSRPGTVRKRSDGGSERSSTSPEQRGAKKQRQRSPLPEDHEVDGNYAPKASSSRPNGLPSLGPDVSLSRRIGKASAPPNYSRPLPKSHSEAYLDPPSHLIGSPSRSRGITRSSRMDLASMANGDEPQVQAQANWSPWESRVETRVRSSITPSLGPGHDLRYGSPRVAPLALSTNRNTSGMSGLTRSSTLSQMPRADSVFAEGSLRGTPLRQLPQARSMAFDSDGMSVDGDRQTPERQGSPYNRMSATPMFGSPSRGTRTMLWDTSLGGFFRDFGRTESTEVQQNEAERILQGLQSSRNAAANRARVGTDLSLTTSLIGASSRELRKAIEVPMAARHMAEQRTRDRLGDNHNPMISPYGRVKTVFREQQQRRRAESTGMDIDGGSKAPSQSPAPQTKSPEPQQTPRRSNRIKRKESEEPTPRKRGKRAASQQAEEELPRATPRRSSRRTPSERGSPPPPTKASAPPPVPTITETAPSPNGQPKASGSTYRVQSDAELQQNRGTLREKTKKSINQRTAPNSRQGSRATSPEGRFSAREIERDEELPGMSDLNSNQIKLPDFTGVTFSGITMQSKPAAAPAASSTLAAPSLKLTRPTSSPLARGRASERRKSPLATQPSIVAEPDTPPQAKKADAPAPKPVEASKPGADGFFGFGDRPAAAPAVPASIFGAAGDKKTSTGLGLGKPATMPRFMTKPAEPAALPAAAASAFSFGTAASTPAPITTVAKGGSGGGSVFGGAALDIDALKAKTADPSPAVTPAEPKEPAPAPLLFGGKSTETASPSTFNLGSTATNATKTPFSFGKPANGPVATEAPKAPVFGSASTNGPNDKPAEAPKFSFGKPAETPEAPKSAPAFTFGAKTSEADKSATSATPSFGFGTSSSGVASTEKATAPSSNTFGAPSTSTPPATDAPKAGFSFGSTPASTTPAAADSKAPFSFGAPASTTPATAPPAGGFGAKPVEPSSGFGGFGAASSKPATASTFTFGSDATKPAETNKPFQFGAAASTTPAAPPSSSFALGQPSSQPSTGFGSAPTASTGFGRPATGGGSTLGTTPTATQPTTGFGQPAANSGNGFGSAAPAANGASSSTFAFGSNNNDTNKTSFGGFGTTTPAAAPPAAGSFTFGQSNNTPTANGGSGFGTGSTGGFGAPAPAFGAALAQPAATNFAFGATNIAAAPPTTFNFSSNPSTPATAAGAFNFGAPATPSNQPFQFGAGSQPASPAVNAATFQFGAPQNAQNGAPSIAARFGSPGPGGIAGTDGGFNTGANPAPASPSNRIIKPLRRKR